MASLFWRVFGLNAALIAAGVLLLALTPLTVSNPVTLSQVLLLSAGAAVMLVANALLLRLSLRPLTQLSRSMQRADVLQPGERLEAGGARELASVTEAFNHMLERLEHERRSSAHRAVGDHEAERRRIATDLHDEVGQSLTAMLLMLQSLVEESGPESRASLKTMQDLTRGTLDDVRRIARNLRPTVLDDLGLSPALAALCERIEESSDTTISQRFDDDLPALDSEVELALYRIAQEALTNIARHAAAAHARVELARSDHMLVLRVEDDGRGMLYEPAVERGGLRGIRERALAIRASVSIASRPGRGTTIVVGVPGSVQ